MTNLQNMGRFPKLSLAILDDDGNLNGFTSGGMRFSVSLTDIGQDDGSEVRITYGEETATLATGRLEEMSLIRDRIVLIAQANLDGDVLVKSKTKLFSETSMVATTKNNQIESEKTPVTERQVNEIVDEIPLDGPISTTLKNDVNKPNLLPKSDSLSPTPTEKISLFKAGRESVAEKTRLKTIPIGINSEHPDTDKKNVLMKTLTGLLAVLKTRISVKLVKPVLTCVAAAGIGYGIATVFSSGPNPSLHEMISTSKNKPFGLNAVPGVMDGDSNRQVSLTPSEQKKGGTDAWGTPSLPLTHSTIVDAQKQSPMPGGGNITSADQAAKLGLK